MHNPQTQGSMHNPQAQQAYHPPQGQRLQQSAQAERPRRKDRRLPKACAALCCASLLAAGGVMAYLTATDTATNRFELADGADYQDKVKVVEPSWDLTDENGNGIPDAAENFAPGQEIAKDPQVENGSTIDSYVVLTVSVPTEDVVVGDATAPAQTELFTYTVNNGWVEQGSSSYDAASKATSHTYLFKGSIDGAAAGLVKASATTPALFNSVTMVNHNGIAKAGDTDDLSREITVTAHAIQALGFDGADAAYAAIVSSNAASV